MRPYKKRAFYNELQTKECSMEDDNEEDPQKEGERLSINEDNDKEKSKDKDGVPRGRKRWKRKISRKQFRHHDIKIFTPGEYKTTLLKPKGLTDQAKLEDIQKESITDAIVTSLGGHKQPIVMDINAQKRIRSEEIADSSTPNILEENNNTNSVQNNNNLGKHHLPAIIMETPSVNRRNHENAYLFHKPDPEQPHPVVRRKEIEGNDATRKHIVRPPLVLSHSVQNIVNTSSSKDRVSSTNGYHHEPSIDIPEKLQKMYNVVEYNKPYIPTRDQLKQPEQMEVEAINDEPEDLSIQTPVDLSKKKVADKTKENIKQHVVKEESKSNFDINAVKAVQREAHRSYNVIPRSNKNTSPPTSPNSTFHPLKPYVRENATIEHFQTLITKLEDIRLMQKKHLTMELKQRIHDVYQQLGNVNDNEIPLKLKHKAQNIWSQIEALLCRSDDTSPINDSPDCNTKKNSTPIVEPPYFPYSTKMAYPPHNLPPFAHSSHSVQHEKISSPWSIDHTQHRPIQRPRSKSHRHEKPHHKWAMRRTLSNPQGVNDNVAVPPMRLAQWDLMHREPRVPPTPKMDSTPIKYPDMYQKYQNYFYNGNPGPAPVRPDVPLKNNAVIPVLPNLQLPILLPAPQQSPPRNPPIVKISDHEPITSTTDHINGFHQVVVSPTSTKNISPRPRRPPDKPTIPAVIVVDNSMEITKETTNDRPHHKSMSRMTVLRNVAESITPIKEKVKRTDEKDQDESNVEFLIWLDKLKKDEKLKSKFLSQMGYSKGEKEDTIEIMDSDDEKAHGNKNGKLENCIKSPKLLSAMTSPKLSIPPPVPTSKVSPAQNQNNVIKITVPPVPCQSLPSLLSPKQATQLSPPNRILSRSLSMPYSPSVIENKSATYLQPLSKEKTIYSPQIEPISPAGSEPKFVFPEVPPAKLNNVVTPTSLLQKPSVPPVLYTKYQNGVPKPPQKTTHLRRKSVDRPQTPCSPRVAPHGKLCYIRDGHLFIRYFDESQVELFIRNLSIQDEELLKTSGVDSGKLNHAYRSHSSDVGIGSTEIVRLPRDVEFSRKEDLREVEDFVKESSLVERFVPKDFADFYRYVTGFQIIKNKAPVSLQTFLAMYNTNRTTELLRKYLQRIDVDIPVTGIR